MNAKPLKLLLLEDRRKDARFLQKAIKDGGSFDCKLVKMDMLEKTLSAIKEEPPLLLLRSGDSNAKLSANLKRVREIASDMPVLVLPDMRHSLNLPAPVSGESPKTTNNLLLNLKKLPRT